MEGRFRRVNPALCRMLGRSEDELIGQTTAAFTHPDDRQVTASTLEHLNADGSMVTIEKRYLRPDGSVVWVEPQVSALKDESGDASFIVSHFKDITAAKETELRHLEATERFETAFANAPIGMALVDLDGRFMRVNRTLAEITGYTEERLVELTFQEITHPDDLDADLDHVGQLIRGEKDRYAMEKRYFTARGHLIWINLSGSIVRGPEGEPQYFIAQIEDISERKRLEESLHRLADVDPLTDLWNRRRFEEELGRQVARCRRYGERAALLMVDLDGFKLVNDRLGHKTGDALLMAIAGTLRGRVRSSDSVARLGGDEFAVLLANVSPDQAAGLADALRDTISNVTVEVEGHAIGVGASVGVAFLDERTSGDEHALAAADKAMYDAKSSKAERPLGTATDIESWPRLMGPVDDPQELPTVRVVHCDDSESYRVLVAEMLSAHPGVDVVASAASGEEALRVVQTLRPDVVLLDARMEGSGAGLVAEIARRAPGVKVVTLSGFEPKDTPMAELTHRFVHKSTPFDELAGILREVTEDT